MGICRTRLRGRARGAGPIPSLLTAVRRNNRRTNAFYFHDITGFHQVSNNNGFYPVTPGYDEATGIGTPNFTALITG